MPAMWKRRQEGVDGLSVVRFRLHSGHGTESLATDASAVTFTRPSPMRRALLACVLYHVAVFGTVAGIGTPICSEIHSGIGG